MMIAVSEIEGAEFDEEDERTDLNGIFLNDDHPFWTVDSITNHFIFLKQLIENDSAYIFDTITYLDSKFKEYDKNWIFVDELASSDTFSIDDKLIFKLPVVFKTRKIKIENIKSFTFAKNNGPMRFDLGLPIAAAALIIGSPIAAFEDGELNLTTLIVGEATGILFATAIYKDLNSRRVKEYYTSEWKIEVKPTK